MHELRDICAEIKGTMFIIFESICNLDDLFRPQAVESLRVKRIQLFAKSH